ncbi:MAG: M14 family metallopeptidase [Lachnospiraceae bacterium]
MIKTVVSIDLPVDERLLIQKHRIEPPVPTGRNKRISIVTGIHGDELEGQFVCYELQRRIQEDIDSLHGIVDVYPALNPLGMDSATRGIPIFDLDMNRIFPGSKEGHVMEQIAASIVEDIVGSDLCVDVHASNIYLREIPQVRMNEINEAKLMTYAKKINVDFIWVHTSETVLESTLIHSLNMMSTPALVVEMGVGMRINPEYGYQIVEGILNLMKGLGIWSGEVAPLRDPLVSKDGEVALISAEASGIFMPSMPLWSYVRRGSQIGSILDPLTGTIQQKVLAPCDGTVFTLREYPIVYHGTLIARILGGVRL